MKLEDILIEETNEKWQEALKSAVIIEPDDDAADRTQHILDCPLLMDEFLGTEEDFADDGSRSNKRNILTTIAIILAAVLLIVAIGGSVGIVTGQIDWFVTPTPPPTPWTSPSTSRR